MVAARTPRALMAASLCLLFCSQTSPREQSNKPRFPVPRAEGELRELLPFLERCGVGHAGDLELFRQWVLPYGPLDLQVENADYTEANALKNLYLGLAGAAFKIDPVPLSHSFHCGPSCVDARRTGLKSSLPRLQPLVASFRGLRGVKVLASWGREDEFRVNGLFRISGQLKLTQPSALMGFTPSATWTAVEEADKYIASLGADPAEVHRILDGMRALELAAIVSDPGDVVRVIRVGIGDNESGLLFTMDEKAPYHPPQGLRDGHEVVLIEPIEPHVYFYETT